MVNVGLSWSSFVGIALALSGAALYFLRSVRPGLARDHDIFFAAIALLCGGILFFQGWRQDPILQFGQFLLAGSTIFFAVESIRLRGVATEQAKRTMPVVDDERPVSRVYRAELDELAPVDERPMTRRIRGSRDARSAQAEDYGDDVRRKPSNRRPDRLGPGERPRRRPPSSGRPDGRPESRTDSRYDRPERSVWDDDEVESTPPRRTSRPSRPSSGRDSDGGSRPRRPRPPADAPRRRDSASSATGDDYVDYQPINYSDDDFDAAGSYE